MQSFQHATPFSSGWGFIFGEYNLSLIKSQFLASAVGQSGLNCRTEPIGVLVHVAWKHIFYFAISSLRANTVGQACV